MYYVALLTHDRTKALQKMNIYQKTTPANILKVKYTFFFIKSDPVLKRDSDPIPKDIFRPSAQFLDTPVSL